MVINKSTIFYFSGTGNSLQVSKDIAVKLGDVDIVSIPKISNNSQIEVKSEFVGIVFPVYMFGLPLIVDDFIKKLKINKNTYIFAVATMGAMVGNALKQINDLIENKGKKLNAGFTIVMPGNYIPLYGAKSEEKQVKAFNEEKNKVEKIVKIIREKRDYEYEKNNLLIEKFFAPLMYKGIDKVHTEDKKFLVKDNCNSCGICEKICSIRNIELKNGKPTWKNKCEQCMACIQYCPKEAIEFGKKTVGRKRYRNPNITLNEMIDGAGDE